MYFYVILYFFYWFHEFLCCDFAILGPMLQASHIFYLAFLVLCWMKLQRNLSTDYSLLTKDLQGLMCFVNVILCSLVSSSLQLQYGEYGLGWEWGWDLPLDQPFVMLCHRLLRVEFFWVCNQKYCSVASMTLALWSL